MLSSMHARSISPVEIRHWNFPGICLPPLENAFSTHVCDNCEITSKTRGKNKEQSELCF